MLDAGLADLTQFDAPPLAGPLAEAVLAKAPHLDRVYFGNSGTEAVEAALKFARYATGRNRIIYCDHAFHGLTAGALSVNGAADFREGFGPMLPGTRDPVRRPGGAGARAAAGRRRRRSSSSRSKARASPFRRRASCPAAHELLRKHKALLIADEVQCGVGRTGDFFAYEHDGVEPDLIATAKALSGGYMPIGATLGPDWVFQKVYSSMDRVLVHDSTFGSNAQAMAAGLATMHVFEHRGRRRQRPQDRRPVAVAAGRARRPLRAAPRGTRPRPDDRHRVRPPDVVEAARRRGRPCRPHAKGCSRRPSCMRLFHRHRILTQVSGDHVEVIKLIPPLIIGEREVDRFMTAFIEVMDDAHSGSGLMWDFGKSLLKQSRSSAE